MHFESSIHNVLRHFVSIPERSYPWRSLCSWRFHLQVVRRRHQFRNELRPQ